MPGDVVRQRGIYEIYDLEYIKSAYVDPGTGRVNGIADRQSGVMGFMRNLHLCALSCEGYPAYIPFLAKPAPVLGNEELTVGGLILAVTGADHVVQVVVELVRGLAPPDLEAALPAPQSRPPDHEAADAGEDQDQRVS